MGLEHWVKSKWCPRVLCADSAQATRSQELKVWCRGKNILQEFSPPYHHASIGFVERFNQTLLNRLRRMWAESPKYFSAKVEQAVDVYNHTPRSREIGCPENLWRASEDTWGLLLGKQKEERQKANWHNRFKRIKGNLVQGQKVWIWNTKIVTLKDKL